MTVRALRSVFPLLLSRPGALLASCVPLLVWMPLPANATGPTTRVEFTASHTERVGGVDSVVSDTNLPSGVDGTNLATDLGSIAGTFGDHTLNLRAEVDSPNGLPRLRARGEHAFSLSGTDRQTDHWKIVSGTQTLTATHTDELSFSNAPAGLLTVEMYWDVSGTDVAQIILNPGDAVVYTFDTDVSLDATTVSPQSGGGSYAETVPWPNGYLTSTLDSEKRLELESYVVMTFSVDPAQLLEVETVFQVEPYTYLNNAIEGFAMSLSAEGEHTARFDESAELVGVVVRDSGGDIVPDVLISAGSGLTYPVLDEVPQPPPPFRVILSPVAIDDTDLGEYSSVQAPLGNMINHTGLQKPFTSGITSFDTYFDFGAIPYGEILYSNNWQSAVDFSLPLQGYVDFDLGGSYAIDRLALWNVSLEDIRVQVSSTSGGPWTEVGAYSLPSHVNYFSTYPYDVLDLGGPHDASFVRIQVDSAHLLSPFDTFTYAIVGEVAVGAITVPEPETWAMLLAGIPTLAGLQRWRRRRR